MTPDLVSKGNKLLEAGKWADAKQAFEEAAAEIESPDAYIGVATASRWLEDIDGAIEAYEKAYRGCVDSGDDLGASRTALSLAELFVDYRGEPAVASGWLQRARHRLREHPTTPILVAIGGLEAYLALAYDKDPATARSLV
jgi:tetratricopeptide (TPR) repeat protein